MIQIQQYRPDTCNCIVLEAWDDSVPEDQRIHTLVGIVRRGDEHASILDASLYPTIREENNRKNLCINQCKQVVTTIDPNRIKWVFTPGRLLQVSFEGINLPNATKQAIQTWCDENLGVGKVEIL